MEEKSKHPNRFLQGLFCQILVFQYMEHKAEEPGPYSLDGTQHGSLQKRNDKVLCKPYHAILFGQKSI